MRCRNCHTALMDTDLVCPSCRTSRACATAAAPEPTGEPSHLLKMLPIFGGALGGVLYAGLTACEAGAATASPPRSGGTWAASSCKRPFGILLLLAGGLFLALAVVQAADTWSVARREPTVVTAA